MCPSTEGVKLSCVLYVTELTATPISSINKLSTQVLTSTNKYQKVSTQVIFYLKY